MVQTYYGFKQAEPKQFPYQKEMEEKVFGKNGINAYIECFKYNKKLTNIEYLGEELELYIPYVKDVLIAGLLMDLKIRQDLIYEKFESLVNSLDVGYKKFL